MSFKPRTTAPATNNKYYIHTSGGGYNKCIRISGYQCLPNCVGYAYGRFMEEVDKTSCKLPMCNAEDWIAQAKANGYKTGSEPKLGAVMCFRKGKVKNSADGAGHVLIVEKINDDGSIVCSQSGYGAKRFWTSTFKKPYKLSGYVFQGFIYNPDVADVKLTYKVGSTYTVTTSSGLNVRKSASTSGKKIKAIPKGTKIKVLEIKGDWLRYKDGWVCSRIGNDVYIK